MSVPPNKTPITVRNPARTLGDIRAAKSGSGSDPLTQRMNEELGSVAQFVDPDGKPTQIVSTEQMSQLLKQRSELQARGVLPATRPPPVPIDVEAMREQFPDVPQHVRMAAPLADTPLEDLGTEPAQVKPRLTKEDLLRKERPEYTDEPEDPEIMDRIMNPKKYPGQPIPIRRKIPFPQNITPKQRQEIEQREHGFANKRAGSSSEPSYVEELDEDEPTNDRLRELRQRKQARMTSRKPADDEHKPADKERVYSGKPRFNLKPNVSDAKFERVNFLSGFVFYPFKEAFIRRFNLPDQMNITKARETQDMSLLIDTLSGTLSSGVDVRDFAMPDFRFLLYWHRWNSYTNVPFNVNWRSKYGFLNSYSVTDTSIKMVPPTITEEEYVEWLKKGFAIPTVRDFEVFQTEELSDEEMYFIEKAQFFLGDPDENGNVGIQQKIDAMNRLTESNLGLIARDLPAFQAAIEFRIEETTEAQCAYYDPKKWLVKLHEQIETVRLEAQEQVADINLFTRLVEAADELEDEALTLEKTLKEKGEVRADLETLRLDISPLDFFPAI
jgi:hypothetical protein